MNTGACNSDHSPTEVVMRALEESGEDADRVTVVIVDRSGTEISQYSNARSVAELVGMLTLAKGMTVGEE